jgi:hypothetical protein
MSVPDEASIRYAHYQNLRQVRSLSKLSSGTLIIKTFIRYAHYQNLHQVRSLSKPPSGTLIIKTFIRYAHYQNLRQVCAHLMEVLIMSVPDGGFDNERT